LEPVFWILAQSVERREMAAARMICACVAVFYISKENAFLNLPDSCRRKGSLALPPRRDRRVIQSREMISDVIKCHNEVKDDGQLTEPVSKAIERTAKYTGDSTSPIQWFRKCCVATKSGVYMRKWNKKFNTVSFPLLNFIIRNIFFVNISYNKLFQASIHMFSL
jgi:hypothetical protein